LREEWEKIKGFNAEALEMTEEDEDELEYILLHDLEETSPNTLDEFNKVLDDQFSVFKEGDEYNFIKDIRDAFKNDL